MTNTIVTFDDLFDEVTELWPRYKTTKTELHTSVWHRLSRYTGTDRFNVLRKHRHDNPDAMRPLWGVIFNMLASLQQTADPDSFQSFLDSLRVVWKHFGVKGIDDMSDADVWQHCLDDQTFPITHNTLTREPKPDTVPCTHCETLARRYPSRFEPCNRMAIACDAVRMRERLRDMWVERIESTGSEPPPFLWG